MDSFEAFQIYSSIKLHFTTEFDCFKFRFKTNAKQDRFATNRNRFQFKKLAHKYPNRELYKRFVAANVFERPKLYILDLFTKEAEDRFLCREKAQQSLAYTIKKDLEFLLSTTEDPNSLLVSQKGNYPPLIGYVWSDEIALETFVILSTFLNAFPIWDKTIADSVIWPDYSFRVKKYLPFIEFDRPAIKSLISATIKANLKITK